LVSILRGVQAVRAAHQQPALERKTQKLLDATPGLVARHLVMNQHPALGEDVGGQEKLSRAQMEIKARIADMRRSDPSKTFRQCWEKLQRSDPQLFEDLPESN
jgi:hypothetical protein